jgi:AraC-like DNA-binding protein
MMFMTANSRSIELLKHLAPGEGYTESLLDSVTFLRTNRSIAKTHTLYEPSIVIMLSGRKRAFHGGSMYVYDADHYLVLSVPLPFTVETEASEDKPLLGLSLRIDPTMTAELAMGVDEAWPDLPSRPATMYATRMDDKLSDATARLLEALCSPGEARLLGPSIVREITFRVLMGDQGSSLREALLQGGNFGRVAKAIRRIHTHYERDLDVATLAREANLSVPAFHNQFKAVTTTTPIQYIKAIRLHQARLLMIRNGLNATTASVQVGYESPSQFSREFKRLFGRTPVEETRHLKELLSIASPVLLARPETRLAS